MLAPARSKAASSPSVSSLSGGVFRTPFCAEYWRCASREFKELRKLLIAALFIALEIAIASVAIPVAPNLWIYFTFLVKGVGAMIYGPVVGLFSGFVADNLSYFLHPSGPYFPGYTLSTMLSMLAYGLFFYRAKVGPVRILLCKLSVNLLINVGLGSLWSAMLYSKGYLYYAANSIVKNTLLLPVECILMALLFAAIMPLLVRARLIPPGMLRWKRSRKTAEQPPKDSVS